MEVKLYSILTESQIKIFKRFVKRNPKRVMGFSKGLSVRDRAIFFEICCFYNSKDAYFASAFGRCAYKTKDVDMQKKALEATGKLLHDPYNCTMHTKLAIKLDDKEAAKCALQNSSLDLSDPLDANVFATTAKFVRDTNFLRAALRVQRSHLDNLHNACSYGSIACILQDMPSIKKAIIRLKEYYNSLKNEIIELNLQITILSPVLVSPAYGNDILFDNPDNVLCFLYAIFWHIQPFSL